MVLNKLPYKQLDGFVKVLPVHNSRNVIIEVLGDFNALTGQNVTPVEAEGSKA